MTIFLDLAGSFLVRASMVTVMLGLTVTMNNALYETTQRTNAAATVATVGDIIQNDLNAAVTSGFTTANASLMVFTADTSLGSNKLATITYQTTAGSAPGVFNLTRTVGSHSVVIANNLYKAQFVYYDVDGNVTSTAGSVDAIRVKLVAAISYSTSETDDRGTVRLSDRAYQTLNDFKVYPPNLN
jgi:hypothetical protein